MRSVWQTYVTFERDLQWLEFSLMSFKKYCKGFDGVVIIVPLGQTSKFMHLEQKYGTRDCPVWIRGFQECPGKGFVHHLAMKMYADVVMPEATHILHLDPDCLWTLPTTPDTYFVDGKPVLVIEPYEIVKQYHPGRYNWKTTTEANLGFKCEYETMCRHPAVHVKQLYPTVRAHIEKVHRTPFIDYYLRHENRFPYGIGEFNEMGSYAVEMIPDWYCFVDCGPERLKHLSELKKNAELPFGHPPPHLKQYWSYSGWQKDFDEIKRIIT